MIEDTLVSRVMWRSYHRLCSDWLLLLNLRSCDPDYVLDYTFTTCDTLNISLVIKFAGFRQLRSEESNHRLRVIIFYHWSKLFVIVLACVTCDHACRRYASAATRLIARLWFSYNYTVLDSQLPSGSSAINWLPSSQANSRGSHGLLSNRTLCSY